MSEKLNQPILFPDSDESQETTNGVTPYTGSKSSGNLSRGICRSSMLSSKLMNSSMLGSKTFQQIPKGFLEMKSQSSTFRERYEVSTFY